MIKNANRVELNTNFFELSCEYANVKDDLKEHKCFQNKKIRWMSCWKWYIIACWCI